MGIAEAEFLLYFQSLVQPGEVTVPSAQLIASSVLTWWIAGLFRKVKRNFHNADGKQAKRFLPSKTFFFFFLSHMGKEWFIQMGCIFCIVISCIWPELYCSPFRTIENERLCQEHIVWALAATYLSVWQWFTVGWKLSKPESTSRLRD